MSAVCSRKSSHNPLPSYAVRPVLGNNQSGCYCSALNLTRLPAGCARRTVKASAIPLLLQFHGRVADVMF